MACTSYFTTTTPPPCKVEEWLQGGGVVARWRSGCKVEKWLQGGGVVARWSSLAASPSPPGRSSGRAASPRARLTGRAERGGEGLVARLGGGVVARWRSGCKVEEWLW